MEIDSYTDQEIVEAILNRNTPVTKEYLYKKCYPLFCSIYNKYYTDCESPIELINEIYVYILMPHKDTHRSKLQEFGFRCTLTMWLKIVTENYCHQLFKKKSAITDKSEHTNDGESVDMTSINIESLNQADVNAILNLMRNKRYRDLIRYRYVEEKTNEETADLLGMSMDNYYNKHRLAKVQLTNILKKEGLI